MKKIKLNANGRLMEHVMVLNFKIARMLRDSSMIYVIHDFAKNKRDFSESSAKINLVKISQHKQHVQHYLKSKRTMQFFVNGKITNALPLAMSHF